MQNSCLRFAIPNFDRLFVFSGGGCVQNVIMAPAKSPHDSAVCLFGSVQQVKLEFKTSLEHKYLSISCACKEILVAFRKFHLDDCQVVVPAKFASRHGRLLVILDNLPYDDISKGFRLCFA